MNISGFNNNITFHTTFSCQKIVTVAIPNPALHKNDYYNSQRENAHSEIFRLNEKINYEEIKKGACSLTLIGLYQRQIESFNQLLQKLDQLQCNEEHEQKQKQIPDNILNEIERFPMIPEDVELDKELYLSVNPILIKEIWKNWTILRMTNATVSVSVSGKENFYTVRLNELMKSLFQSARKFTENLEEIIAIDRVIFKDLKALLIDPISLSMLTNPYKFDCGHRVSMESLRKGSICPYKCGHSPAVVDNLLNNLVENLKELKKKKEN